MLKMNMPVLTQLYYFWYFCFLWGALCFVEIVDCHNLMFFHQKAEVVCRDVAFGVRIFRGEWETVILTSPPHPGNVRDGWETPKVLSPARDVYTHYTFAWQKCGLLGHPGRSRSKYKMWQQGWYAVIMISIRCGPHRIHRRHKRLHKK